MRLYQQRYVTFFQNSFSQKRRYFLFLFSFHSNCCIYTRKLSISLCIIIIVNTELCMEVFVNDIHSSWNYPHHDVTPVGVRL